MPIQLTYKEIAESLVARWKKGGVWEEEDRPGLKVIQAYRERGLIEDIVAALQSVAPEGCHHVYSEQTDPDNLKCEKCGEVYELDNFETVVITECGVEIKQAEWLLGGNN